MARRNAPAPTETDAQVPTDAPVTDAPVDAPTGDVTPDAPTPDAPTDAPTTDAPASAILTDAEVAAKVAASRRDRTRAQAAKPRAERFKLDAGAEWRTVDGMGGADIGVCNSTPNAQGESFLYAVYRSRGREIAIPLAALYALIDAEDV